MVEVTVEFVVGDSAIFLVYRKSYGGHNLDTGHWDPGLLCLICTLYAFTPKNRFRKQQKRDWERRRNFQVRISFQWQIETKRIDPFFEKLCFVHSLAMGGGLLPNFMTEFRIVVNLRARRTDNLVVAESENCKGGLSTSCSMFQ